jgi:hypothetical protein
VITTTGSEYPSPPKLTLIETTELVIVASAVTPIPLPPVKLTSGLDVYPAPGSVTVIPNTPADNVELAVAVTPDGGASTVTTGAIV